MAPDQELLDQEEDRPASYRTLQLIAQALPDLTDIFQTALPSPIRTMVHLELTRQAAITHLVVPVLVALIGRVNRP